MGERRSPLRCGKGQGSTRQGSLWQGSMRQGLLWQGSMQQGWQGSLQALFGGLSPIAMHLHTTPPERREAGQTNKPGTQREGAVGGQERRERNRERGESEREEREKERKKEKENRKGSKNKKKESKKQKSKQNKEMQKKNRETGKTHTHTHQAPWAAARYDVSIVTGQKGKAPWAAI